MLHSLLKSRSLVWITDPWSTLDPEQDTTLRLAQEAMNLGVKTYWCASDFVLNAPPGKFRVIPFEKAPEMDSAIDFEPSILDQFHYRVDPPVDSKYRSLARAIRAQGLHENQFFNPSELICTQSEKIPPPDLLALAPPHLIVQTRTEIEAAYETLTLWGEWVSKPLNLAQSIGVKKWSSDQLSTSFLSKMKEETSNFSTPILLEQFLPDIEKGEVRMWFVMGKFLAALKKHPVPGDFRVLIDSGSKIEAHLPSPAEQNLILKVESSLKRQKIALAAVDFIGPFICDYNITSPGLLVQLEKVHGNQNFAKEVILRLLNGF